MNNVYDRLRQLLEGIGLSFEQGGFTKAEIMAYSTGISIVQESLDAIVKSIFLTDTALPYLFCYCKLIGLNEQEYTPNQLVNFIKQRLTPHNAFFNKDEFEHAFDLVGGSYTINGRSIVFSNMDSDSIKRLGAFIESYTPFCVTAKCSGNGLSFNEWAAHNKSWNDFDQLKLRFDALDTLGGEIFE